MLIKLTSQQEFHFRLTTTLEPPAGLEPATIWLQIRSSTNWAKGANKTLRLYVMMLGLLLDYLFPSYPRTFDSYPNNAGYLSKPLFKLLLFDYSRFTLSVQTCGLINLCRGYKFFERIIFDLRSLMALDNPILCRHLSSATGKHFCFNFD